MQYGKLKMMEIIFLDFRLGVKFIFAQEFAIVYGFCRRQIIILTIQEAVLLDHIQFYLIFFSL